MDSALLSSRDGYPLEPKSGLNGVKPPVEFGEKKILKLGFEIRGDWFLLWIPIYLAPAGLPNPLTITSLYPHSNCAS